MSDQKSFIVKPSCDIFCRVIDNFGDAGVCWRLAKQLANEYCWELQLIIDDLKTLQSIVPTIHPNIPFQKIDNVNITHWQSASSQNFSLADIVIEAFSCNIPSSYLLKMAEYKGKQRGKEQKKQPLWINLDYLNVEHWAIDYHLQPSPHPQLPLKKYFFFPSIRPHAGGIIQEKNIYQERIAFLNSEQSQINLWQALGIPKPPLNALIISLFCYQNSAIKTLLHAWKNSPRAVVLIVPKSNISTYIEDFFDCSFEVGQCIQSGHLTAYSVPFMDQKKYDHLLWICDINFVRGEDSFVRAQLAGRPFIWQIYPQENDAHFVKLNAMLEFYGQQLNANARAALIQFYRAWNQNNVLSVKTNQPHPHFFAKETIHWTDFYQYLNDFNQHAKKWTQFLSQQEDVASQLQKCYEKEIEC